ncbi:MAG: hypothetical protein ABL993_09965 [Vicinamibacterales bacterium]
MSRWFDPRTMVGRCVAFYAVLALPLLRLLVRQQYDLLRPEVAALLVLLLVPCLVLAA